VDLGLAPGYSQLLSPMQALKSSDQTPWQDLDLAGSGPAAVSCCHFYPSPGSTLASLLLGLESLSSCLDPPFLRETLADAALVSCTLTALCIFPFLPGPTRICHIAACVRLASSPSFPQLDWELHSGWIQSLSAQCSPTSGAQSLLSIYEDMAKGQTRM
jgi:hypothetical protein